MYTYKLFNGKLYNDFLANKPHIYVNVCKSKKYARNDTKILPAARINRLLSSGALIISEPCNPIDDHCTVISFGFVK